MIVIGDIHGQFEKLTRILRDAGLVNDALDWTGETAALWFLGDYFNRGPDGVGAVDLIRKLQGQAANEGGAVSALLGNHDVLLLSALLLGNEASTGPGGAFREDWLRNGGAPSDLERLEQDAIEWLVSLPAMAVGGGRLLMHADALFYHTYGDTPAAVNETFGYILGGRDPELWDRLLDDFSQRRAFLGKDGKKTARDMMRQYGGETIVHGHTPITKVTGEAPESVRQAYLYAGGLCANVDHGLYLGGPGFVTVLEDPSP